MIPFVFRMRVGLWMFAVYVLHEPRIGRLFDFGDVFPDVGHETGMTSRPNM